MAEFTPEQILAKLNTLPRAQPALKEVLTILEDSLPGVLALPEVDLPPVATYGYVGCEVGKWPAVLVGAAIRSDAAGHAYMDASMLSIIYAYPGGQISKADFERSLDAAQVIRGLMSMETVVGPRFADDGTTILWNTILPAQQSFVPVPPDFGHFSGWQVMFEMTQYPVAGALWPTPEE